MSGKATQEVSLPLDGRLDGRLAWILLALLLALHVALIWLRQPIGITTLPDDSVYVLLGRSLRHFSYRNLYLVGTPLHAKYPPGYPALLAAWGAVGGEGYRWLLLPNLALSALALGLLYAGLRRAWNPAFGLLCLGVLAVNPYLVRRSGYLVSEPLYLALALTALWAASRTRPSRSVLIAGGCAAIAAALTRSIGVAVVAALGAHWLLQRRYRAVAGLAVATSLFLGAWLLWALHTGRGPSDTYLVEALAAPSAESSRLARTLRLAIAYGRALPDHLAIPLPGTAHTYADNLLGLGVLLAGLLPGLVLLFRRWRAATLYLLFYGAALLVWPYHRDRYLEPLLFFLVPAVLLGVHSWTRRLSGGWRDGMVVAVGMILLGTGLLGTGRALARNAGCPRFSLEGPRDCMTADQAAFFDVLAQSKRLLPPDATLLTTLPQPAYLYTGLRGVPLGPFLVYGASPDGFRRTRATHVLLSRLRRAEIWRLASVLEANCRKLELVAASAPRAYLFRISAGSAPDSGAACAALRTYREFNRTSGLPEWLRRR